MAKKSVKAKKRLEARQRDYEASKLLRSNGYTKPGSLKK